MNFSYIRHKLTFSLTENKKEKGLSQFLKNYMLLPEPKTLTQHIFFNAKLKHK